jgi:hypothetical protein
MIKQCFVLLAQMRWICPPFFAKLPPFGMIKTELVLKAS